MEMWIVKGQPRIGLFAGKKGLEAGEEITYGLYANVVPKTVEASLERGRRRRRQNRDKPPQRRAETSVLRLSTGELAKYRISPK